VAVYGRSAARLEPLHSPQRLTVDALAVDLSALVNERHGSGDLARLRHQGHLALTARQPFDLRAVHARFGVDAQHVPHALNVRALPRLLAVEVAELPASDRAVNPLDCLDAVALLPHGFLGTGHRDFQRDRRVVARSQRALYFPQPRTEGLERRYAVLARGLVLLQLPQQVLKRGLGYLTLGQPLSTLSGGECQRIKLASELHKEGSVYVLDEPTTGLHMSDITHLLTIMDRLVDGGNTVIAIEHNLDVIRRADWIIDLGPEGGSKGGRVMFSGPPKKLLSVPESLTGRYLQPAETAG
jgi:ABC transporter family protein